jgi:hypothetical protein
VNITRNDITHQYYVDGRPVGPSVTTILDRTVKRGLYDGIPKLVMDQARDRGTLVHRLAGELHHRRVTWDQVNARGPDIANRLAAWYRCVLEHRWTVLAHELKVYDAQHDVPGTIDVAALTDLGHPIIADLKCGDPAGVQWQTAQYVRALCSNHPDGKCAINGTPYPAIPTLITRYGVELRGNGSYRATAFPGSHEYFRDLVTFDACLTVYRKQQEIANG